MYVIHGVEFFLLMLAQTAAIEVLPDLQEAGA